MFWLQALEERFHQNIEPAVSSALAARQADRVANLAALMTDLGRESELEGLYVAARLPMLQVGRPYYRVLVDVSMDILH